MNNHHHYSHRYINGKVRRRGSAIRLPGMSSLIYQMVLCERGILLGYVRSNAGHLYFGEERLLQGND